MKIKKLLRKKKNKKRFLIIFFFDFLIVDKLENLFDNYIIVGDDMKKNTFKIMEDGVEKEYLVVKLCDYNKSNFVIYKEDDSNICYASKYSLVNENIVLDDNITEEEWDYLNKEFGGNNE